MPRKKQRKIHAPLKQDIDLYRRMKENSDFIFSTNNTCSTSHHTYINQLYDEITLTRKPRFNSDDCLDMDIPNEEFKNIVPDDIINITDQEFEEIIENPDNLEEVLNNILNENEK